MSKRALYTIFLAFALLFAQQGAAWHALSHVGETPSHAKTDPKLPHGDQCTKCAAFSQLGAAFTSAAPVIDLALFGAVPALLATAQYYLLSFSFYQSRAPPHRV